MLLMGAYDKSSAGESSYRVHPLNVGYGLNTSKIPLIEMCTGIADCAGLTIRVYDLPVWNAWRHGLHGLRDPLNALETID